MLQPFFHGSPAPLLGLGAGTGRRLANAVGVLDEPFRRFGMAIEQHIFDQPAEIGVDVLIYGELTGVDDPHVEPGADRVVQEAGVDGLPDRLVPAEGERDVAHPSRDAGPGAEFLDAAGRLDEVERVSIVFFDARADGEDVRIEDDVFSGEIEPVAKQAEGPGADFNLPFGGVGLPSLVERHHHHGGAVFPHLAGLGEKSFLSLFQADGVDDALALHALESRLDDLPLRAVDHHRDTGDVGLAGDQVEQAGHRLEPVEHPLIEVDVDQVGAPIDLVAGDLQGRFVVVVENQPGEPFRARDVAPLAHHREVGFGKQGVGVQAREAGARHPRGDDPRTLLPDCPGNRLDVGRGRATAATDDVQPALGGELPEDPRHGLGSLIEASHLVGEAGVGVAGGGKRDQPGEFLDMPAHQVGAKRAVDAQAEQWPVLDTDVERLERLAGEHPIAPGLDKGRAGHDREADRVLGEVALDRQQAGLEIEGVECGFGHQNIDTGFNQCRDLPVVRLFDLIESLRAEARIVGIGRERERNVHRTDRARHKFRAGLATGPFLVAVDRLASAVHRGEVQLPDLILELVVGHRDGLGIERVGLEDVGTRLEIREVHIAHQVALGDAEEVIAALQFARVVGELLASEVGLAQLVTLQHGAHGAVQHQDPVTHQFVQQVNLVGSRGNGHGVWRRDDSPQGAVRGGSYREIAGTGRVP